MNTTSSPMDTNGRLMNTVHRLNIMVDGAKGSRVHDRITDRWLLDFWGDEGVAPLGYNSHEMNEAVGSFHDNEQPHRLPDIYPNPVRFQAASILCDRTGMDRVFLCNSGAEANEAMIKLARRHAWVQEGSPMLNEDEDYGAKRHRILTVAGNFHGRTGFALAANDHRSSPYHRWGYGETAPGFGVIDFIGGEFKEVVRNGKVLVRPMKAKWDTVAAVTMAPILGNNVVKTYPAEFWKAWAAIRAENPKVLLMFDDVQAGNGRSGYFASWQNPDIGVKPDIMALGKGISLGFAASAMLASEEVAKAFTPGVHFNTFGGSMWTCHMTNYLYKWLDGNLDKVRDKGARIRAALSSMEFVNHVDGAGMLNAFTPNFKKYGYNGFDFMTACREHNLLLCTHRALGPIRFTPPLNVEEPDLLLAYAAMQSAHNDLVNARRGEA